MLMVCVKADAAEAGSQQTSVGRLLQGDADQAPKELILMEPRPIHLASQQHEGLACYAARLIAVPDSWLDCARRLQAYREAKAANA
jgi:hypothetical protein